MELPDFDYDLPDNLIAQAPPPERGQSRLMVVDRSDGSLHHSRFRELPGVLEPDDLLVVNDSRVLRARLEGTFADTGGRVEVLLLRRRPDGSWQSLLRPARRCRPGRRIRLEQGREAEVLEELGGPVRRLRFEPDEGFDEWLETVGEVPLPPYIRRPPGVEDRDRYQTVYARAGGSVAAPTAGLHFSPDLLRTLDVCALTLHVGYGTFQPVSTPQIEDHVMETEPYTIGAGAASRIAACQRAGGRIVAVGTTTTRALEHAALQADGRIQPGTAEADVFIYPGFRFRIIDALLTNFHLPRSTLLMLVSAFAGTELIRGAYREAVREQYRFYSYGDAMLIR